MPDDRSVESCRSAIDHRPIDHSGANRITGRSRFEGGLDILDLAWVSLAALVVTVVLSCATSLNPGVIALVFAWVIGVYLHPAGTGALGLKGVVAGFPSELFLTLAGVTLLFGQAQANGTLERVTRVALRGCRGNAGLIPLAFFGLAMVLGSVGAGSIAAAALVGPAAMAVAGRAGIPAFLMTIMVAHGAVAGRHSPFPPTGGTRGG